MKKKEFLEGIDYYLEKGFVIFTEKYLLQKKKCCFNNCRHCPFDESIKGNKSLKSSE